MGSALYKPRLIYIYIYIPYVCLSDHSGERERERERDNHQYNSYIVYLHRVTYTSLFTHTGEVVDTDSALLNFDGITYGKGSSLLKQLVAVVGMEGFKLGPDHPNNP